MSDLPQGWEWSTIGELGRIDLGRQRAPKWHNGPNMRPYLRVANVFEDRIDLTDVKEMDFGPADYDRFRLERGDILLNEGQSPEWVGRPAMYRGELPGVCFTNSLIRFRPHDGIDGRFALYLFRHLLHSRRFMREARITTNIAHLSVSRFATIEVCIPPTQEQSRIVEALEEHLSRLGAAETALQRSGRRLAALAASVASTAFEIDAPRAAIGAIGKVGSGATPARSNSRYWADGTVPWVTSGALNDPVIDQPSAFISEAALRETAVKLWPSGTVLVAMYGEGRTRGRAAELVIESTCNQACAAIQVDPQVVRPRFLRWFLNSQYQQNRALASGGVQPNLSVGLVRAIEVPTPSLDRQDQIVAELEERADQNGRLVTAVEQGLRRAECLRNSLLASAFSGKLVPQDPDDEPASLLMERTRAERGSAPPRARRLKAAAS